MEKIEIKLEYEKATQNTWRYKELPEAGQPPKLKYLYLQKWVVGETAPKNLKVTIEEG